MMLLIFMRVIFLNIFIAGFNVIPKMKNHMFSFDFLIIDELTDCNLFAIYFV